MTELDPELLSFKDAMKRSDLAELKALREGLAGTTVRLDETITEVHWILREAIRHHDAEIDTIRIRRVISEGGEAYLQVAGWSWPLTRKGKRSARRSPGWVWLPDGLAEVVAQRSVSGG